MTKITKDVLKGEIARHLMESPENRLDGGEALFFDEPLVNAASGDDPLFTEFKSIIGESHMTPKEAFELSFGEGSWNGGSVVSVVMPVGEEIRKSNRARKDGPSREWALLRTYGDLLRTGLLKHIEAFLCEAGHKTVAPATKEFFKIIREPSGSISNWSERHVAYAAGLGTFGLNEGFISERGMAIVLASFVTELKLEPDFREASGPYENCLKKAAGLCGACIRRCPAGALSENAHDKMKCYQKNYGDESRKLAVAYGGKAQFGAGCGLCQTGVPCEFKNPMRGIDKAKLAQRR